MLKVRACVTLVAAMTAVVSAGDWPQFRGRNSSSVSEGAKLPAEIGPDKNVVWKATLPPGHSSPVVVGDRVYAGCLSEDGNFYVLDLKTGKKLQELELESPVGGSVGVGPDCVLVGTDKGVVYCLGKK